MADPATIAMAAKAAVAAATDKRTWKVVGAIGAIAVFIVLIPVMLITAILSGGAEHNKETAEIVFNYDSVPVSYPAEYRDYIIQMQDAFQTLDEEINDTNMELAGSSLDAIRVKAVFYCLYFGTDFSGLDEGFYADFTDVFTEPADDGPENLTVTADLETVYDRLSALVGRPITETDKANIDNLYYQIRYGYAINGEDAKYNPLIPGEAFDDENFAALMEEATKFIGYRYVWGGSTPSESFDCSGFVCWSYTESGVYNLPRTTAQGIFNQCAVIAEDEVKPGDLAFFTETYDSVNPVTHIGIIVSENLMLHCGDPIGYADLTESYWRKHFFAYARLGGSDD